MVGRRLQGPRGADEMALCEHRFVRFDTLGDDESIGRFAQHLDELFDQGWSFVNSARDKSIAGLWQVELFRELNPSEGHIRTPA